MKVPVCWGSRACPEICATSWLLSGRESDNDRAKLALEIYIHRLCAGIGAMIAVLGGIDALVFTAGVGENSSEVRAGGLPEP